MVEIEEKYKIYEKKFGYFNWLGFYTLISKEIFKQQSSSGEKELKEIDEVLHALSYLINFYPNN